MREAGAAAILRPAEGPLLMRVLSLAFLTLSLTTAAQAADFDLGPLRGASSPESGLSPIVNWEGGYVGAFAGLSTGNWDYGPRLDINEAGQPYRPGRLDLYGNPLVAPGGLQSLVARHLAYTVLENEFAPSTWLNPIAKDPRGSAFGVFGGYNFQMDEIVFGVEADYTRSNLKTKSSDAISRFVDTSTGYRHDVRLDGKAETELNDYGTFRARLGYAAGSFMPFVTAGAALGQYRNRYEAGVQNGAYNIAERNTWIAAWNAYVAQDAAYYAAQNAYDQALVLYNQQLRQPRGATDPAPTPPTPPTVAPGIPPADFNNHTGYQRGTFNTLAGTGILQRTVLVEEKKKVAFGLAFGAGLDVQVTPNLFLRGEWQFVHFDDLDKQTFYNNTFRAAAGLKF